jgi:hypothetical protein
MKISNRRNDNSYFVFDVFKDILDENKFDKNGDFKEEIYKFNELDLWLSEGVNIRELTEVAQYRHSGLYRISRYLEFDPENANKIDYAYEFLQSMGTYLHESEIKTSYEYYIDGRTIIPSEEQKQYVINYLRSNNIPVNELSFCLALRRLIVGGDIESKFDKTYLIDKANNMKSEIVEENVQP